MKNALVYAIFLVTLFGFATQAQASCELAIVPMGETVIQNYDGFDNAIAAEDIRIRLINTGRTACQGDLEFEARGYDSVLRNAQGDKLAFNISSDNSLNQVLFNSRLQTISKISLTVPAQDSLYLAPVLSMPSNQSGQSGRYTTELIAIFRNHEFSELNAEAPIALAAELVPVVQANFAGLSRSNGSVSSLDLGALHPGLTRRFGLQLRSNSVVDLNFSSDNQGTLKHESDPNSNIPYALSLQGKTIDLSTTATVVAPADLSTNGITNPMQIRIKEFKDAVAGDYSDTIFVRISAR